MREEGGAGRGVGGGGGPFPKSPGPSFSRNQSSQSVREGDFFQLSVFFIFMQ